MQKRLEIFAVPPFLRRNILPRGKGALSAVRLSPPELYGYLIGEQTRRLSMPLCFLIQHSPWMGGNGREVQCAPGKGVSREARVLRRVALLTCTAALTFD